MEQLPPPFPYRAEYAPTNQARCKGCGEKIEKNELRIAAFVPVRKTFKEIQFGNLIIFLYCYLLHSLHITMAKTLTGTIQTVYLLGTNRVQLTSSVTSNAFVTTISCKSAKRLNLTPKERSEQHLTMIRPLLI